MTKRSDIQKKAEAKIAKILADVPSTTGKSETIFTPAFVKGTPAGSASKKLS